MDQYMRPSVPGFRGDNLDSFLAWETAAAATLSVYDPSYLAYAKKILDNRKTPSVVYQKTLQSYVDRALATDQLDAKKSALLKRIEAYRKESPGILPRDWKSIESIEKQLRE